VKLIFQIATGLMVGYLGITAINVLFLIPMARAMVGG
jgi:hypothetical protein